MEPLDLPKSNCARPVLPGLLDFTSLEEFLLGGFASHSRLELPPDWLLPRSRWTSLCSHLGQLSGWWWWWGPFHILQLSCFLHLPLCLFYLLLHLSSGWGLLGWGWVVHWGGGPPSLFSYHPSHLSALEHPPLPASSILFWHYLCSCHSVNLCEGINQ